MAEAPQQPISIKLLATALIIFLTAVFGGVGIAYYLGAFTKPVIHATTSPPLHIAYLDHIGPYDEIEDSIEKVAEELHKAGTLASVPFGLLLDEVGSVPREKMRSKAGYIIDPGAFVPGSLREEVLPSRDVVLATFEGSALIGSYKSYEGMKDWATFHGYVLQMPALEIYRESGTVEYQLGISKQ
jgi:effector-binding domain-containing protein